MPRRKSPVKAGKQDQRDRGRRKKHHNRSRRTTEEELRTRTTPENWERKLCFYENWLAETYPTDDAAHLAALPNLNLNRYLQTSPSIDVAPDERLRQLAIHWESVCAEMPQPKGWKILERIYLEARKYDRRWGQLYHSMSLSMRICAGRYGNDKKVEDEMLKETLRICDQGILHSPETALLFMSRGRSNYELGNLEQSIVDSDKAIALDPKQMWAALYRAHALHDLKRWAEAIEAYRFVDLSFFDGDPSWRAVLLKDQLVVCLLEFGDRSAALEIVERSLHSYETNPGLLFSAEYLVAAARGELKSEIGDRVLALLKRDELMYYWD